jgi:murein L,D-transpeptidase YcbB/YkuD
MLFIALTIVGCATTRPKPAQTLTSPSDLQSQLQAKDQEIQDLQYQLDSRQQGLSNNFASGSSDKYNLLRVPGVSATDVQKALLKAGFDPGPVDGRLGKKTRAAIKAFQKQNHLTADGVVGEKTWAALRSY